jgi:acetate kinase
MSTGNGCILTVNGGSSSIKFALFEAEGGLRRILGGQIEGIGLSEGTFSVRAANNADSFSRRLALPDHATAVNSLMDWIQAKSARGEVVAVGHRVVHGGPNYSEPQRITPEMIDTLRQLEQFDPEHLPEEILLTEAFERRFPTLAQIACFDTAFHREMPPVARLLPIPRRYYAKGVQRYGFHGLSCAYLIEEISRLDGRDAAHGRVILAHLGNGASITAVKEGKSIDTSMSFTPTAGLPMSTRAGDLDPGLGWYLEQTEKMPARQFHHMINHECGLLGVSELSSDMRELLAKEASNPQAAEAVALFCYQAKKWVCALAGALEGLDTLVFSAGIGENAPEVRARICRGLDWIGIQLDENRNRANEPIISQDSSRVTVRMIRTDEECIIARMVCQVLGRQLRS